MACYYESYDDAKVSKADSVKSVPLDGRAYVICNAKAAKQAANEIGIHAFIMNALDMLEYLAATANTEVKHTEDKRPRVAIVDLNYRSSCGLLGAIRSTDIFFKAPCVFTDKNGVSEMIVSVDNLRTVLKQVSHYGGTDLLPVGGSSKKL